jgi:arylsulfatase A-like enzyme
MRKPILAAVAAALAVGLSCGGEERPLNLLVIGVDTLRPDHLGCYGYGRETSPRVDRLAAGGVLFTDCVSQSPWTLPSFASLFTSLYPSQHGAMTIVTRMRESFPTLAEILAEEGYATGAVINAAVLKSEYGIDRGFHFYDPTPPEGRLAAGTTRDALEWIDRQEGPFFMFAHYFDPHEPYSPPGAYARLWERAYQGPIGDGFVLREHFPEALGTDFEPMRVFTEADWRKIVALYDGEIAYTDSAIGVLLDGLAERRLLDHTLVVFMSDHGE